MTATLRKVLSNTVDNLTGDDFKRFKHLLRDQGQITWGKLGMADTDDTVELMVQVYSMGAGDIMLSILKKMKCNRLAMDLERDLGRLGTAHSSPGLAGWVKVNATAHTEGMVNAPTVAGCTIQGPFTFNLGRSPLPQKEWVPGDHIRPTMTPSSLKEVLSNSLDNFTMVEFKRFKHALQDQGQFTWGKLVMADTDDTVDLMVQVYSTGAGDKMLSILKKMNHNQLAMDLERNLGRCCPAILQPAMSGGPPHMPAPVCLIENAEGGLRTVESALKILRGIQQPVVVVAVVGLYRTGKSYLMNRLAGQRSGFALGSTIESKTKGIWIWCVPHPSKPGHTLLLLDTEGLGDVDKGDSMNDAWIFCLGVLLSSTLVYNSRGTIDNKAVEELHYVTELTDLIRIKSASARDDDGDEEESKFVHYFPDFVWAVRDFTLERKINGQTVSEDEYLGFALHLRKGVSTKVMTYNLPRQCIRNFFPSRKCFTFPFPSSGKNMRNLDSMAEADLCPDFRSVADRFCSYVFAESRVKTVQGGHKVTGSRFSHLVKIYVDTINSGSIPCLENAVVAMAEIENQSAVKAGLQLYEQGMGDLSKTFPMDLGTVSAEHQRLNGMAMQEFLKRSFKDEGGKYMTQLMEKVSQFYDQLITLNMEASEKLCRKLLLDLYGPMAANIQQGRYSKAGGYEIYCCDRDAIVAKYRQQDKKGMKGEEVLEKFLQEKNGVANFILKTDERLTEADKKMAEAREQARVQEQRAKAEQQRSQDLQRALEDERRSLGERMRRLEEKMEEEKKLQQEEFDRALESKLKEQREMMEKGFKDQAEIMDQEIKQLKKERQQNQAKVIRSEDFQKYRNL